jgi:hypothetical protein
LTSPANNRGAKPDAEFYDRADAHINLSNNQITDAIGAGKVSASMLYATARFSAFVKAVGASSGADLAEAREEIIEYFCAEYRKMLSEHLDDYIEHFDRYLEPGED